jgi:hypothetical protein
VRQIQTPRNGCPIGPVPCEMERHPVLLLLAATHACAATPSIALRAAQCKRRAYFEWPEHGKNHVKRTGFRCCRSAFHEKAFLCQAKVFARPSGDRARGLALLRGEPPFLRRGGNPPAPAFPFGETGKGSKDSLRSSAAGYVAALFATADSPCFHPHSL